ncbi:ABC transporter ATP-binding protein [uncultured Pseudodesulfovibrio sp.]|uniref:ABC transporter ATP-binding protein n=1 Tax=uncultured Pseudodesulfovibrio sp. TaxID=2035858 RepID=UPI0037499309
MKKHYATPAGDVEVLKGVNAKIFSGEMVSIMGPSGCGKSTLLYILGMLQSATSGRYQIMGQTVSGLNSRRSAEFRRKNLGFVLQSCNLFEHSTVVENLEYPLIYGKISKGKRKQIVKKALQQVGLSHRIGHPTNRLSGGEQQRVAIARALVNQPAVIFGDEPTGQLDRKTGDMVMNCFKQVAAGKNRAVVLVTHDMDIARRCDRQFVLSDGILQEK